jgi:hypothetical protein
LFLAIQFHFVFPGAKVDLDALCFSVTAVESERGKRLREDSLMLVRGLDSIATSLVQLSDTLTSAQRVCVYRSFD